MPICPAPRTRTTAFKAWVWLLLCALLLQAGAGAVVQVLGRTHSHQAAQATPAVSWLGTLLAWRADRLQALQATGLFKHANPDATTEAAADHHHDALERHHHGPADTSVQAVDSASSDATADSGQSAGGSAALVWGLNAERQLAAVARLPGAWPGAAVLAWSSALSRLPERPPRV